MNGLFLRIFIRIGWILVCHAYCIAFSGRRDYTSLLAPLATIKGAGKLGADLVRWCCHTILVAIARLCLQRCYRFVCSILTLTYRALSRDLVWVASFLGIVAMLSGLYAYQWYVLDSATPSHDVSPPLVITTQTPPPDNPVLATYGAQQIKLLDIIAFAQQTGGLGTTEQLHPADAFHRGLVLDVVDQYLLSSAAEKAALHEDPNIKANLSAARRRILASAFLNHQIAQQVTKSKVRALYDRQRQALIQKDEMQLQKIVLNSREEAMLVSRRVVAGTSFADLVKAYATTQPSPDAVTPDTTAYISYDQLPSKAADIIYATPVGAITEPLKIDQHWHIFKVMARRPTLPPTYPEIRDEIERFLTQKLINDVMHDLRAQALVSYHHPAITDDNAAEHSKNAQ